MSGTTKSIDIITAEAAEWFTRNREDALTHAQREQFLAWLSASPLHIEEYLGVAESWQAMQAIERWPSSCDDDGLMAGCDADNVLAMVPGPAAPPVRGRGRVPLRARAMPVAAALVLALGIALVLGLVQERGDAYRTGLGEHRSVVLEDGSVMQLNAMTRVRVRYGDAVRCVELIDGEAYFKVAHEAARPFDVVTPEAVVRAVGTAFNVYRREDRLDVAVTEGRVRVSAGRAAAAPADAEAVFVSASEGVVVRGDGGFDRMAGAAGTSAPVWTQRRLVFDGERLDAVVAEFNRYTKQRLQLDGAELAGLRISGTFNADDPETLLAYLEQIQGVRVERTGRQVVLQRAVSGTRR